VRRHWQAFVTATLGLGIAAACGFPDPLDEASWSVGQTYPAGSPIEVGDTATLHASARYCDLVTCPHAISELEPHRFRWESANPAVADISERCFLRARSVGAALIRVTFLGSNGGRSAQFTTPVVSSVAVLSPRFDRDTARVGDTVSVTIGALDEVGNAVPATAIRYWIDGGAVAPVVVSARGQPGDFVLRLHIRSAGNIVVHVYRDYIRPAGELRTSDTLTALPVGG
jgi:hypothetical protein